MTKIEDATNLRAFKLEAARRAITAVEKMVVDHKPGSGVRHVLTKMNKAETAFAAFEKAYEALAVLNPSARVSTEADEISEAFTAAQQSVHDMEDEWQAASKAAVDAQKAADDPGHGRRSILFPVEKTVARLLVIEPDAGGQGQGRPLVLLLH